MPALAEVLAQIGRGGRPARATLLQILLREKRLIRVSDELVVPPRGHGEAARMLAARRGAAFSVRAFKEWTGISRKYAIPLLEYLDRERVTRRDGDEAIVL